MGKRLLRAAAVLAIIAVAAELMAFIATCILVKKVALPRTLFDSFSVKSDASECTWGEWLSPHPYLAFRYHHARPGCMQPAVNQIGFAGRDIPARKDPNRYTILVLGGSVAEALVAPSRDAPELETLLNRELVSPSGKPFYIMNGAIGAGSEPMQAITFLLLHDVADAVISLEGFNEHYLYGSARLEQPPEIWWQLTAPQGDGYRTLMARRAARDLFEYLAHGAVLSRSYSSFFVGYALLRLSSRADAGLARESLLPPLEGQPTLDEKKQFYVEQYAKYLRAIQSLASARGMKSAFFLQPVPALFKPLTANDRAVAGDLSYGRDYAELTGRLLQERGLAIFGLLEIFRSFKDDLYADEIHFKNPEGNRILAREMVKVLEREWQLARRH